jgi:hypothetical protein
MCKTLRTIEEYERVMSYKGRLSRNATSRITRVPAGTISGWWSGQMPKEEYTRRQKAGLYHLPTPKPVDPEESHRKKVETHRRWYYRSSRHRKFHPKWNPDQALAPLDKLWLRAGEVTGHLDEAAPYQEIRKQLELRDQRRLYDMYHKQKWVRYDIADRIYAQVGMVLSGYEFSEPVYARHAGGPDNGC